MKAYRDIIVFMVTLLIANFFWKYTVIGEEDVLQAEVTWFGLNITAPFNWMCRHISEWAYRIIRLFRDTVSMPRENVIVFASGAGISIVWGCSGLKQMFIWICLILTVKGGWKHKIWFIPFGLVLCHLFNILRIALIAMLIEFHPERFDFYHGFVFKYLFYGMMFLLWVWFIMGIRGEISESECDTATPAHPS